MLQRTSLAAVMISMSMAACGGGGGGEETAVSASPTRAWRNARPSTARRLAAAPPLGPGADRATASAPAPAPAPAAATPAPASVLPRRRLALLAIGTVAGDVRASASAPAPVTAPVAAPVAAPSVGGPAVLAALTAGVSPDPAPATPVQQLPQGLVPVTPIYFLGGALTSYTLTGGFPGASGIGLNHRVEIQPQFNGGVITSVKANGVTLEGGAARPAQRDRGARSGRRDLEERRLVRCPGGAKRERAARPHACLLERPLAATGPGDRPAGIRSRWCAPSHSSA